MLLFLSTIDLSTTPSDCSSNSADGKHWTTWQYLEADAAAANGPTKYFRVRSAFPIASAHPTTSYGWSMPDARMCPGAAMRRPWSRKSSKASRGFSRRARPSSGTCSSPVVRGAAHEESARGRGLVGGREASTAEG